MQFEEFKNKTRSQKIVLATIKSKKQAKVFNLVSGFIYERYSPYFVSSVFVNGISLNQVNGLPGLNEFNYSPLSGMVQINIGQVPTQESIFFENIHFYSTLPANLPYDLDSGEVVYFEPRIRNDVSDFRLELDYENTGIALETSSNISLINNDGLFDDIFDTHIWEGQDVKLYAWGPDIPASEAKLFYRGIITEKSFTPQEIRFNIKDALINLRQVLSWPTFQDSDYNGEAQTTFINKPKRLIFGTLEKLKCNSLDIVGEGYALPGLINGDANRNLMTGLVDGVSGFNTITGTGTLFLSELNPGDKILVQTNLAEYNFTVLSISSNTSLTITSTIGTSFSSAFLRNLQIENNIIKGIGTDFINDLSPKDQIKVTVNQVEFSFTVGQINSATELVVEESIESSFSNYSGIVEPIVAYRRKNRDWHICAHGIYSFTFQVLTILDDTITVEVDNPKDLRAGDTCEISGRSYVVVFVSGNKVRFNVSIPVSVMLPATATMTPVSRVFINKSSLVYPRDYSIINTPTESKIQLNELAEFNIARVSSSNVQLSFTNGSNIITLITSDIDLTTLIKTRDWIRPKIINIAEFYEVLSVSQSQVVLRQNYLGPTEIVTYQLKSPEYVTDETLLTVSCKGLEYNDEWIRTPAQAVKYILEQSGETSFNDASFDQAKADCDYDLSLAYPYSLGGDFPEVRQMITDINQSVFGSLYLNNSFEFTYSILNADKPEDLRLLRDDDILSFSTTTKNNIKNRIILSYRPTTDLVSGEDTFNIIDLSSDFVNQVVGQKDTLQVKSYIYDQRQAENISERWLFFRSLSQSVVTIKAKLEFIENTLNDKMAINLNRLFKRYGGADKIKIGVVNMISKDGINSEIRINDLGNVFNRVGAIAPDTTLDYASSERFDIAKWAFIVDNETETPDLTENELGNNLIG